MTTMASSDARTSGSGRRRRRPLQLALGLALIATSLPVLSRPAAALPGDINTVAGTGIAGYNGDNQPAASAHLNQPEFVTVDSAGNIFIADENNYRVRKIDPWGIITTVAGNGTVGYSGDGGPATAAQLGIPRGVSVDAIGNLYIADSHNHNVRRVSPTGVISTVAGNGTQGSTGDGGPATSAQLGYPHSVAVDGAGNLYIGDSYNHRIRRVDPTGIITTIAGNGTPGLSGDGGPANTAQVDTPHGVAVDSAGNIYIADTGNHRIRKVDPMGLIKTVAGDGPAGFGGGAYAGDGGAATSARLNEPHGVTPGPAGDFYIADQFNHRIRKVDATGVMSTVAGNGTAEFSGDGGPATSAGLGPRAVALDAAGNLYISDPLNHRIRKVDAPQQFTVALTPPAQQHDVGALANLTAHVSDAQGRDLPGVAVVFARTGPNGVAPTTVVTDANGDAAYSYAGTAVGTDAVQATVAGASSAAATVTWSPAAVGYPSNDCSPSGTNIFDGFVDDAHLKLRTQQVGSATWVCVAVDDGTTHVGGKVVVDTASPPDNVALDANQGACDDPANVAHRRFENAGEVGPVPYHLDANVFPTGEAWVCVLVGDVAQRVVVTTDVPSTATFLPDLSAPFPYVETPPPAEPSSACQLAPSGRARLVNADVGAAHLWLYTWAEPTGEANVCVRAEESESSNAAGGRLRVDPDGGVSIVNVDSVFDFTPCDTNVWNNGGPPFPTAVKVHAGTPAWVCVQVGGTVRRIQLDPAGGQGVVGFTPDTE